MHHFNAFSGKNKFKKHFKKQKLPQCQTTLKCNNLKEYEQNIT